MTTLLFVLLLTAFLAALGPQRHPPQRTAALVDLDPPRRDGDVVRGGRVLVELDQRQRRLWEIYLDERQPWHRESGGEAPDRKDDDQC